MQALHADLAGSRAALNRLAAWAVSAAEAGLPLGLPPPPLPEPSVGGSTPALASPHTALLSSAAPVASGLNRRPLALSGAAVKAPSGAGAGAPYGSALEEGPEEQVRGQGMESWKVQHRDGYRRSRREQARHLERDVHGPVDEAGLETWEHLCFILGSCCENTCTPCVLMLCRAWLHAHVR